MIKSMLCLIPTIIILIFWPVSICAQRIGNTVMLNLDKVKVYNTPVKIEFNPVTIINNDAYSPVDFKEKVAITAEFTKGANFYESTFRKTVDLTQSTFLDASFSNADFQDTAEFALTMFKKRVSFTNAKFNKQAFFIFTKFADEANFSGIITSDSTSFNFDGASFPDLLDFSFIRNIHNTIDLTYASFDSTKRYSEAIRKWHYINLYNSDISKIKIDYQHFRLCFYSGGTNYKLGENSTGDKVNSFIIKGDSLIFSKKIYSLRDTTLYKRLLKMEPFQNYLAQIFPSCKPSDDVARLFLIKCVEEKFFPKTLSKDEIISIFETELKSFEVNGQKVSYENMDIDYRDFKFGRYSLAHIWYCYGYHKEWIFLWTAGFIFLFTIITFFFIGTWNNPVENNGTYYIANIPIIDASKSGSYFFSKLWYSLIYTTTIFFLLGLKIENLNFKKPGVVSIILMYLTGLLCLGYMTNFVLQK
jgi:uncharacterized protein YjbI with pentapeptide repeats